MTPVEQMTALTLNVPSLWFAGAALVIGFLAGILLLKLGKAGLFILEVGSEAGSAKDKAKWISEAYGDMYRKSSDLQEMIARAKQHQGNIQSIMEDLRAVRELKEKIHQLEAQIKVLHIQVSAQK